MQKSVSQQFNRDERNLQGLPALRDLKEGRNSRMKAAMRARSQTGNNEADRAGIPPKPKIKRVPPKASKLKAYSQTMNIKPFIEKGAFGKAMIMINQDQMASQMLSNEARVNEISVSGSDSKMRKKSRLNQIVTAAYKGKNQVKPSMEAEDIAHQYHMLKIDHNEMTTQHKQL